MTRFFHDRGAPLRRLFYRCLTGSAHLLGPWFFALVARGVALGYFIFFPNRVRIGLNFYGTLFPGRSQVFYRCCVLRQYQNFTRVFLDRFRLKSGHGFDFTFEGRDRLEDAVARCTGGIIVMSHMGNWELAAHLLHDRLPGLPLMLFLGQRAGDAIEQLQKQDLNAGGIRVVTVDQQAETAFELLPAVEFLRSGGFVSLTGDRVWHPRQRTLAVRFLGRSVHLPEAPHALALVSGAPLYFFFTRRKPDGLYHFTISPPRLVTARARSERRAAIGQSAQFYAGLMEVHLRSAPYEWYHFEPFL